EIVLDRLDVLMIVRVLDVEVGRELPALELPSLVDAQVELMEKRKALAVRSTEGDRNVSPRRRVEQRVGAIRIALLRHRIAHVGRDEVAGNQTEARAELPAVAELIAPEDRQDVRLIVGHEALRLAGSVDARAARDRVREPSEEALVGLVLDEN